LGSAHSLDAAPKPAFKVTRSPFAPKITGQGGASAMSFSSAAGPTPPKPVLGRKASGGGSAAGGGDASPALLAVDFICAAVAIGAAVMIWLHSR
jgi:hypothetical protein